MKTMDVILVIVGALLLAFTVTMIWLFYRFQSVPDVLVTAFFACLGTECGVMGWIKTAKEKARKEQEKEDEEE